MSSAQFRGQPTVPFWPSPFTVSSLPRTKNLRMAWLSTETLLIFCAMYYEPECIKRGSPHSPQLSRRPFTSVRPLTLSGQCTVHCNNNGGACCAAATREHKSFHDFIPTSNELVTCDTLVTHYIVKAIHHHNSGPPQLSCCYGGSYSRLQSGAEYQRLPPMSKWGEHLIRDGRNETVALLGRTQMMSTFTIYYFHTWWLIKYHVHH